MIDALLLFFIAMFAFNFSYTAIFLLYVLLEPTRVDSFSLHALRSYEFADLISVKKKTKTN